MRKVVYFSGKRFNQLAPRFVLTFMGLLLLLALAGFSSAAVSVFSPGNNTVVIDPGHGGYDPGATNGQGLDEKDINLMVARLLKENLTKAGLRVVMTREDDSDYVPPGERGGKTKKQTDLDARISLIHQTKAQVCISLHVNATTNGSMSGAEVFYEEDSEDGKLLAQQIQAELRKINSMKPRLHKAGKFYLTENTRIPTVLVELGYLSNAEERKKLQQPAYQGQLAQSIAKGTMNYLAQRK